jgi:hypothetical protein
MVYRKSYLNCWFATNHTKFDCLLQIIPRLVFCSKASKNGWFATNNTFQGWCFAAKHPKMDGLQQTILCE